MGENYCVTLKRITDGVALRKKNPTPQWTLTLSFVVSQNSTNILSPLPKLAGLFSVKLEQ